MWSPDRPSHSTALWTVEKKESLFTLAWNQSSLSPQTKPSRSSVSSEKKGVCGAFSSRPLPKNCGVCTETSVWIISSSKLSSWSPGTAPRSSFVWGNKPFVEPYSSLFSMAHLRNAARVPFFFWNCCLLIHILGVNVLPSVHITHLGG